MKLLILPDPATGKRPTIQQFIAAKRDPSDPRPPPLHRPIWEVRRELADLGVEVLTTCRSPDLVWFCGMWGTGGYWPSKVPTSLLASGFPIVVDENERSNAGISPWTRELLSERNVVGLVKGVLFRPRSLYQADTYGDLEFSWYHARLIHETQPRGTFLGSPNPPRGPALTPDLLAKVELGTNYFLDIFEQYKDAPVDLDAPRPIDVFYAGTLTTAKEARKEIRDVRPPWNVILWAKRRMLEVLEGLRDLEVVAHARVDGDAGYEGGCSFPDYVRLLTQSKVIVSPWGPGERCFRDFEAFYGGAVLVKPDTSFLESWPDVYRNGETYVPCRPDFSDLGDVIRGVVSRWDEHRAMRERCRTTMLQHADREKIARHYKALLERCLGRAP